MRRQGNEEEPSRTPAAKPVPGGMLPDNGSALLQGFDESLLTLQRTVGNRATLRMLREDARDTDDSPRMDAGVRAFMEHRFRADLGDVRIHRGGAAATAARRLDSAAFTVGNDIFFGAQRYSPHTPEGTQLLAHELAHVLQQRGESGPPVGPQHEAEASAASKGIASGSPRVSVQKTASPGIAKQTEPPPATATAKLYKYTFEGQTFTLTEEQYQREIARTIHNLGVQFNRVESNAEGERAIHKDFLEHTHNVFGVISDIIADTAPPQSGIWSWPRPAINAGREALRNGKVEIAGRQLKLAEDALRDAEREWNSYLQKTISGAQTAQSALETTRDISFAIAIGTAAVVAAPVVAAGAATLGATGATGTLVTGAVVTAGGGVAGAGLRAGSAAAGQELAFGHVQGGEVWKEAREGFKHGAIDASTALVTAGTGRLLGEGASVGGKVLRHAVAGGVGGGFSSGSEAISEGKSAREILKATGVGIASGFAGGGVTKLVGGTSAEQSAVRRIVSGGAGSVVSGTTGTILSGGSREDVKRVVATSLISGIVSSAAAPEPASHTPEEPPPTRKEPPRAPEIEATRAQTIKTPSEFPAEPEKLPSNVVPREKLERMRLKKLAARPAVEERSPATPTKDESNVRSLEEMRQRKAAAAAKKPQPPTEPDSQVQPVPQSQPEQEELKLAAGAESQGVLTAGETADVERRLKVVASAGRGRPGGDLRGVTEFREREIGKARRSFREESSEPASLSQHVEELGETKTLRDLKKSQKGRLVDEEKQLHMQVGKVIEPVEREIFGGDLIAKGATVVHENHEFPGWLRKIFPQSAQSTRSVIREGPDLVAIDEKSRRIHVGDVTAKPSGSHLAKTVADARKIAANLPEVYQDYELVAQERYYGGEQEYSREMVVKPGRTEASK